MRKGGRKENHGRGYLLHMQRSWGPLQACSSDSLGMKRGGGHEKGGKLSRFLRGNWLCLLAQKSRVGKIMEQLKLQEQILWKSIIPGETWVDETVVTI